MLPWLIDLPVIDVPTSQQTSAPTFRATTTCPDPTWYLVGAFALGLAIAWSFKR